MKPFMLGVARFTANFVGWLVAGSVAWFLILWAVSLAGLIWMRGGSPGAAVPFLRASWWLAIVAVFGLAWWRGHRALMRGAGRQLQRPALIGAYAMGVVVSGALVAGGVALLLREADGMFGRVSWHRARMGWFQPRHYGGPPIPTTARHIHLEQAGWLDPFLLLRFSDSPERLNGVVASLGLALTDGVRLPGTDTMLEALLNGPDPRFQVFHEVRTVTRGRSFMEAGDPHGRCLVIDDDAHTLYYFVW